MKSEKNQLNGEKKHFAIPAQSIRVCNVFSGF